MENPTGDGLPETLEQLTAQLRALHQQGERSHYRIGVLVNHAKENRLAENAGYPNLVTYFREEVVELSEALISLCGTLARAFSEEVCATYGAHRLQALLTYEKVAKLPPVEGDPGQIRIEVPVKDGGGAVESRPFAECSLRDVQAAIKHQRGLVAPVLPPADAELVHRIHQELGALFEGHAPIKVKAHVHRDETLVSFENVPLSRILDLAMVLQDNGPLKLKKVAAA